MNQPSANKPFIDKPDEHSLQGNELFCFIDSSRPCTPECVAYLSARPEGKDYEGQGFAMCAILVNAHKIGKHVTALAIQGSDLLKHFRIKRQDDARSNQPLPPKVV